MTLFWRALALNLLILHAHAEALVFTAIPDEDESKLKERFGPMSEYLSKTLDIEVSYVPVKSYAAAVSAFRNGQVQLAWFGALSGVQARSTVPNCKLWLKALKIKRFWTYLIAHKSTGLKLVMSLIRVCGA